MRQNRSLISGTLVVAVAFSATPVRLSAQEAKDAPVFVQCFEVEPLRRLATLLLAIVLMVTVFDAASRAVRRRLV